MVTRIGGKTSARRIAADSPPPSRTASAMVSVACRSRRLDTVRAVIVRPSSTGRPAAIMVDRVRAIRAPCRSRVRRPTSGSCSRAVSTRSRIAGLRKAAAPATPAAASNRAASQPQSRSPSDRPITIRVSSGRVWFRLSN